jgi:hypothetical protein
MKTVKPFIGLLLFVGITSACMLTIHYSSKANDIVLAEKINSLDNKINKLELELSYLDKNTDN